LPDVQERLQKLGMQITGSGPDQYAAFVRSETAKWGRIVRDSGAKID
jgi:tripartite-type tricarboxylate transporter receptor subunit TctC